MLKQRTFQQKQSGPHLFETQGPYAPKWYIVDAKDLVLGRLASAIAKVLIGKHKPTFTRHADSGDFVIITNVDKIRLTGNKMEGKLYRHYSGYIGGLKTFTAKALLERDPGELLRQAVWGMTGKSALAHHQMKKLKLFAGSEHPHAAQNPQPLPKAATFRTVLSN
jgi:large subunit ribosomal protein L13